MTIRTWHLEATFDAALLGVVVLCTTPLSFTAWLGALAVWLSARHASVADRLREAEEERQQRDPMRPAGALTVPMAHEHAVSCVAWLDRYLVSKEVCWIVYFLLLGAWPALVGAVRFLVWPWWRRWYRRRRPRNRSRLPRATIGA